MPCIDLRWLDQAGIGIWVPLVWDYGFNSNLLSDKHHLNESDWLHAFCMGLATENQDGMQQFPPEDKMCNEQGSLLFGIAMIY